MFGEKDLIAMTKDVAELVQELDDQHPIELLTCFFCSSGCEEVLAKSTVCLEKGLRRHRMQRGQVGQVELHPATLLTSYEKNARVG